MKGKIFISTCLIIFGMTLPLTKVFAASETKVTYDPSTYISDEDWSVTFPAVVQVTDATTNSKADKGVAPINFSLIDSKLQTEYKGSSVVNIKIAQNDKANDGKIAMTQIAGTNSSASLAFLNSQKQALIVSKSSSTDTMVTLKSDSNKGSGYAYLDGINVKKGDSFTASVVWDISSKK